MVIAGVLLIFAVLLDAYRRVRTEKNSQVRVKLVPSEEPGVVAREVDLAWLKELPNGGGRSAKRGSSEPIATERDIAIEPQDSEELTPAEDTTLTEDVVLVTGINAQEEPENIDWLDGLDIEDTPGENVAGASAPEQQRLTRVLDPEVFMLNVVARSPSGFNGGDILHILLACDLRFGDMSFFHRHEEKAGLGPIQFSVANMMQPGVFDLDEMADVSTPGLVFFLTLPGPDNMMQAFDYMLETARAVARNLEGDVLDETRSAMTSQTLEHSRQKVRDLERRMLTPAEHQA